MNLEKALFALRLLKRGRKAITALAGLLLLLTLCGGSATIALADSPITVVLDPKNAGALVPEGFSGLSYEMALVLPSGNGKYYFSPGNQPLIRMFQTLGIKTLRVGGNTADRPTVKVPEPADIDSLFAFATRAGVKVIFTLRLRDSSPEDAAKVAKYVMDHYKSDVVCFAVGNEPNVFAKQYDIYRERLEKYMAAINAVAPDARFCGPSTTPGKAAWARDLAKDLGPSGKLALITQHDYPGASALKVTNVVAGRDKMLSTDWINYYEKFYNSFVPAAISNRVSYRLEEANSYFNGGLKGGSDTFTSALWGLDYLHWWAAHGANGINFHTGDSVASGETNRSCWYASFVSSPEGYNVRPIAYGTKTFDLGSHGRIVPAQMESNPDNLNLTAYAVLAQDKTLLVTLINKEHGAGAREANVSIMPGQAYGGGEEIFLSAPQGDVAATTGITLGGASIKDDGSWNGSWTKLGGPAEGEQFNVKVPVASAVVIKLRGK